ncbi:pentapeptide repeat-containing protein [Mucilaginibacter sp. AW1-3]
MLLCGVIVIILANACLLVNIRLFTLYYSRILLYDLATLITFVILVLYQEPKLPNYITTNSGKKYTISRLAIHNRLYIDRVYRFTKIPAALAGSMLIQTANDDKTSNQGNMFSVSITSKKNVIVYYLFDQRLYPKHGPGWLAHKKTQIVQGLASTDKDGEFVMVADTLKPGTNKIVLGGNQPVSDNNKVAVLCSMYLIAIKGILPSQMSNTNDTKADIDRLKPLVYGRDSLLFGYQARQEHLKWLKDGPRAGHRLDFSAVKRTRNTLCFNTDFTSADLSKTKIDSSGFNSSVFNDVEFSNSRFTNVTFFNSHLDGANFNKGTLTNCSFLGSSLRGAIFTDVNLNNVSFACTDMAGVIFEPDTVTNVQEIASAYNLDSVSYRTSPGALIKLREQLKTEGFTEAQRKITAAIQRRKFELNNSFVTKWISCLLFDVTSDYGLNPFQPLFILVTLIYLFYRFYLFLFFIDELDINIKHKTETKEGNIVTVKDSIQPGRLLFLSILTSFSIGFGPYNLNDWAKKLLKEDYTLESSGWTRILIGVQNLVSLYLFALTVLLLFGDPFNF